MHQRPHRAATSLGAMMMALALVAAVLATQALWRPMLPGADGGARAADVAAASPAAALAPDAKVTAFAMPRDYQILTADGALSEHLHQGPGDATPVVERLSMHDAVVGIGTSPDRSGADWVWVTRASDGVAGFVHQGALLRRDEPGAIESASAAKPDDAEVAAGKRLLDARYKQLLANAVGYDRAYLSDGQKLWEAQRRRCDDIPDPDQCRKTLDTRRRGDLEGWRDAELLTRQGPARPKLTAASLDTLQ